MDCHDWATLGHSRAGVAACVDCGGGSASSTLWSLPRTFRISRSSNRIVVVEPLARALRREVCAAAQEALAGSETSARSRKHRGLAARQRAPMKAAAG